MRITDKIDLLYPSGEARVYAEERRKAQSELPQAHLEDLEAYRTAVQLLPLEPEAEEHPRPVSTVYEPEAAETLAHVMPDFLAGRLYSAVCDSYVSEVSARRTAMDSATKNAGDMISSLSLKYNRARQGAITQEITEIVAGAEQ